VLYQVEPKECPAGPSAPRASVSGAALRVNFNEITVAAGGQNLTLDTQEREVRSRSIAVVQDRPTLIAKRSFRTRSSANNPSLLHIAEGALARPSSSVRIAQFYSGEVLLIRKAHIDAYLTVPEL
jgi:hypothetical protein